MRGARAAIVCLLPAPALSGCMGRTAPGDTVLVGERWF